LKIWPLVCSKLGASVIINCVLQSINTELLSACLCKLQRSSEVQVTLIHGLYLGTSMYIRLDPGPSRLRYLPFVQCYRKL